MKHQSEILPSYLADTFRDRVETYNVRIKNPREQYQVVSADNTHIVMEIYKGICPEDTLYYEGEIVPAFCGSEIDGHICPHEENKPDPATKFARYVARGTVAFVMGVVSYLFALGVLFLLGGAGFLLPLVAPALLWIYQGSRAVCSRLLVKHRLLKFLKKEMGMQEV